MKEYQKPEIHLTKFSAEEAITSGLPQVSGGVVGGDDELIEDP